MGEFSGGINFSQEISGGLSRMGVQTPDPHAGLQVSTCSGLWSGPPWL